MVEVKFQYTLTLNLSIENGMSLIKNSLQMSSVLNIAFCCCHGTECIYTVSTKKLMKYSHCDPVYSVVSNQISNISTVKERRAVTGYG